jgi:hypothetical protein
VAAAAREWNPRADDPAVDTAAVPEAAATALAHAAAVALEVADAGEAGDGDVVPFLPFSASVE